MESRITKNLKLELRAIVGNSMRDILEESISEHDRKISTQINESVLNNTQQMAEKLEAMFQQNDELVEKLECLHMKNSKLDTDLNAVKASQNFINAEFEIQKDYLMKLDQMVKDLSESNKSLLSLCTTLQKRFDTELEDLAQYVRRENLEFHGIPFKNDENTDRIIVDLGRRLGITVERLDLSISHRIPRKDGSNTGPIIVRFTNRNIRNQFIAKKYDTTKIKDFGIADPYQHI
uniref:uncharacterized protein LOC120336249 n=1 Tax=Styela clava TaxID=7725 RepID=UPI0019395EE0|nr:uncharacterized protein LOC120336249 [Styela clava]